MIAKVILTPKLGKNVLRHPMITINRQHVLNYDSHAISLEDAYLELAEKVQSWEKINQKSANPCIDETISLKSNCVNLE